MDSGSKPKRVAGGLVLKSRKKKRRSGAAASSLAAAGDGGGPSPSVPSILTAAPAKEDPTSAKPPPPTSSEFDDSNDEALCADAPSDALLCLRSYTRPAAGDTMAETCAYCPIFTHDTATSGEGDGGGGADRSTHAAPFLPKHVLLHLLSTSSSSGRTGIEQEVKQLAMSNEIRLLQLHGTAACAGGAGGAGFGGDGNDDDDVAVVESSVYDEAAKMALQNYFAALGSQTHKWSVDEVHSWLTAAFLPHFAGKTWISEWALNSFLHAESNSQEQRVVAKQYAKQHSMARKKEMIQQLVHAGILLPRRGVGPGGGGEGHWISLPGIGRAARSIVDGRTKLLRRLRSSKYKEKKRSTLEHEIGRIKRHPDGGTTGKSKLEQSGKIVVLDLLAKGWVRIHTTCEGEQFVRLVE